MELAVDSWEAYKEKYNRLFKYGLENDLIRSYDKDFIERLRGFYYGGIPLSILLLTPRYCNGKCYDCALFATFGMGDDDFRMVDANIDNLRLQPRYAAEAKKNSNSSNHCFVERTLENGKTWVYDTTFGLVFDRDLYYLMENPQITKVNDKQAVLDYIEYRDIRDAKIDNDKYMLPAILPNFERMAESTSIYKRILLAEIARFKKEIHYDELCREIEADMRRRGFTEDNSEFLDTMLRALTKKEE